MGIIRLLDMTTYHANASKLQAAMRRRRGEMKMTQREVAELGGLSRIAIIRYEKGEISEDIRQSTLRDISRGLKWPQDRAAEILEDVDTQEVSEPEPEVDHDSDEIDMRTLTRFVEAVNLMQKTLREDLSHVPGEVQEAMHEVTIAQTDLVLDLTDRLTTSHG